MRRTKWLVLQILLAAMVVGCATWKDNTYKAIGSAGISYDIAMKSAGELKRQGKITDAQWQELTRIANSYYVSYMMAVDAFEIAVKVESAEAKDRLNTALMEVSAMLSKVLEYIDLLKGGAK